VHIPLPGLKLAGKGPDHATISINRVRRFRDNNIAEKVLGEILRQCAEKGLVGGQILYTDSAHQGEGEQAQKAPDDGGGSKHEEAGQGLFLSSFFVCITSIKTATLRDSRSVAVCRWAARRALAAVVEYAL
jgi:hypothetical protein